jgi:prepilin peptidase CpaA
MRTAILPVIAWGLAVLVTDLAVRRIPNLYSLGAAVVGLVFLVYTGEAVLGGNWIAVLLGAGLALVLTLPGYLAHWLGAGDVKLLFAIALLGGWQAVLVSFAVAGLLGGLLAGAALLLQRYTGRPLPKRRWLPFGAALALGLLVAIGIEA